MPWTETTRCQYERNNERYSSDVTDAEWAVIFRFCPAPTNWGALGKLSCAKFGMGLATSLPPGARGLLCQRTFHRFQRFDTISTTGVMA